MPQLNKDFQRIKVNMSVSTSTDAGVLVVFCFGAERCLQPHCQDGQTSGMTSAKELAIILGWDIKPFPKV